MSMLLKSPPRCRQDVRRAHDALTRILLLLVISSGACSKPAGEEVEEAPPVDAVSAKPWVDDDDDWWGCWYCDPYPSSYEKPKPSVDGCDLEGACVRVTNAEEAWHTVISRVDPRDERYWWSEELVVENKLFLAGEHSTFEWVQYSLNLEDRDRKTKDSPVLARLDLESGGVDWVKELPERVVALAARADELVLAGPHKIMFFSRDGELQDQIEVNQPMLSDLAVLGDGKVVVLRERWLAPGWKYDLGVVRGKSVHWFGEVPDRPWLLTAFKQLGPSGFAFGAKKHVHAWVDFEPVWSWSPDELTRIQRLGQEQDGGLVVFHHDDQYSARLSLLDATGASTVIANIHAEERWNGHHVSEIVGRFSENLFFKSKDMLYVVPNGFGAVSEVAPILCECQCCPYHYSSLHQVGGADFLLVGRLDYPDHKENDTFAKRFSVAGLLD